MELAVSTTEATEVVDVTSRVEEVIPDDSPNGVCTVFVPHTTAGVTVNEAEPGLLADLSDEMARLIPPDATYGHDDVDDNAAAHLRSMLLGGSVAVPVRDGSLSLDTWQSILFVEFDGPRVRRLRVAVTGETRE